MNLKEKKIETLMRKEVASKCVASALAFGFFGVLIYFYGFRTQEYFPYIKNFCMIIVASCILRIYYAKKILADQDFEKSWLGLKIIIWINTVAWAGIFALTTHELDAMGPDFAVMLAIMTGFISASILTLCYDKTLFIPYQIITLVPQIVLFVYSGVKHQNEYGHMLAMTYVLYMLYQYKQYVDYRKQVLARFNYQQDLEQSLIELKESKEALVSQTAELMHTSRIAALGEMAAGIAHEINNPLMIIQGSSEQIERSLKNNTADPKLILNRVNKAKTSIFKIKGIIEGLQFFSQEKKSPGSEAVELSAVLDKTLHICSEMLKVHDVKLLVSELPHAMVEGSPIQLSQVIFNLIKNADDAVTKLVDKKDRWIKIDMELKEERVKLKVTNGGPPIRPEYISKLFQPFFTTKDVGQGIGLSLSISRGITLGHHGELFLEPGKNTTFTMDLPIKH